MSQREFDIVVFGATGFTGTLVAEYLATKGELAPDRWAIAGRDRVKLTEVRAKVSAIDPRLADLEIITANSDDVASLRAMAERASVVLTTVGPYARYGEPLVATCVDVGTDYVDLTGEPMWWKEMIDRYHHKAKVAGVTIVPCCGFDSIPHDLGALHCAQALAGEEGDLEIDAYVASRGTFSGGTWASALEAFSNIRKTPGALVRPSSDGRRSAGSSGPTGSRPRGVHRSADVGRWVAPLPTIDPQVVRRSAKQCDDFGGPLRYRHWLSAKSGFQLAQIAGGLTAAVGLAQFGPTRRLLERLRPSGAGPDAEERARSWFKVTFVGRRGGRKVVTRVSGRDPGYGETSKMIAESALTLALDRETLPRRGGVLTPVSAMGERLTERLRAAGIQFDVVDSGAG